jgi:hypothetical protein
VASRGGAVTGDLAHGAERERFELAEQLAAIVESSTDTAGRAVTPDPRRRRW